MKNFIDYLFFVFYFFIFNSLIYILEFLLIIIKNLLSERYIYDFPIGFIYSGFL